MMDFFLNLAERYSSRKWWSLLLALLFLFLVLEALNPFTVVDTTGWLPSSVIELYQKGLYLGALLVLICGLIVLGYHRVVGRLDESSIALQSDVLLKQTTENVLKFKKGPNDGVDVSEVQEVPTIQEGVEVQASNTRIEVQASNTSSESQASHTFKKGKPRMVIEGDEEGLVSYQLHDLVRIVRENKNVVRDILDGKV